MMTIKALGAECGVLSAGCVTARKRKPLLASRNGFILMEVLAAGVILGIALIALNVAVARCVHGLSVSRHYKAALEIMNEQLKSFDVESGLLRRQNEEGTVEQDGLRFDWKHELIPTDDPKLFREIIQVRWKQSDGPREETWESYRWEEK